MGLIQWEQDKRYPYYWQGKRGNIVFFEIDRVLPPPEISLVSLVIDRENKYYSRLDNAKTGAERLLRKWLKDAGLRPVSFNDLLIERAEKDQARINRVIGITKYHTGR